MPATRIFETFVPITKVDSKSRLVYGVMAEEALDKTGEIFDYESSRPFVEAWSQSIQKRTEATGQATSLGNVREMHSRKAAGKLVDLAFDDLGKKIPVVAHVQDDDAWQKVESGVYTGFSIGGRYVRKWKDETTGKYRYTADPSEVSLVDNPAMYGAQFTAIKADGTQELRKFTGAMPAPADVTAHLGACEDCRKSLVGSFSKSFGGARDAGWLANVATEAMDVALVHLQKHAQAWPRTEVAELTFDESVFKDAAAVDGWLSAQGYEPGGLVLAGPAMAPLRAFTKALAPAGIFEPESLRQVTVAPGVTARVGQKKDTLDLALTLGKIIKREGGEWVLYSQEGDKVLGRHKTKAEAITQEKAILAQKAAGLQKGDAGPALNWVGSVARNLADLCFICECLEDMVENGMPAPAYLDSIITAKQNLANALVVMAQEVAGNVGAMEPAATGDTPAEPMAMAAGAPAEKISTEGGLVKTAAALAADPKAEKEGLAKAVADTVAGSLTKALEPLREDVGGLRKDLAQVQERLAKVEATPAMPGRPAGTYEKTLGAVTDPGAGKDGPGKPGVSKVDLGRQAVDVLAGNGMLDPTTEAQVRLNLAAMSVPSTRG